MKPHCLLALVASLILAATVSTAVQPQDYAERLARMWSEANGRCRGGSGNDPATLLACEERDVLGRRLNQLGRCYGRTGELGYQMNWHRCTATSRRPS